jgi:flagellar hook-length control protein FliK
MDLLNLLLPIGANAGSGPGSKTGSGQAAGGFEQLLFGLLGTAPTALGGQVPTTTPQLSTAANAIAGTPAAALLAGAQAAIPTVAAPPVGLVEAASKAATAATAGLTAAQAAAGETGKAAGAVSQALINNGLSGTQLPGTATNATPAAATVPTLPTGPALPASDQAKLQAAATAQGAAHAATPTQAGGANSGAKATLPAAAAAAAAAATAATGSNIATDTTNAALATANQAAAGAQKAASAANTTAAAATGVPTAAVQAVSGPANGSSEPVAKTDGASTSLISGSGEVATAKTTIAAAVIQAPGANVGKQGATSGNKKGAGSATPTVRSDRPAPVPAGETVAQQAQAAAVVKSASRPAPANTATKSAPTDNLNSLSSGGSVSAVDVTPVAGSASPAAALGMDGAGASNAAARHGAPVFAPPAEQVALQFSRALNSGSDHITIRLQPESLGRVDVQLELTKDGRLTAMFVADRPETLDMLQRDARILERALNDAGLRADASGLSFNLRGEGGDLPKFANELGGSDKFSLDGDGGDETASVPVARHALLNADALLDIQV